VYNVETVYNLCVLLRCWSTCTHHAMVWVRRSCLTSFPRWPTTSGCLLRLCCLTTSSLSTGLAFLSLLMNRSVDRDWVNSVVPFCTFGSSFAFIVKL